jgi:hypothetical protein
MLGKYWRDPEHLKIPANATAADRSVESQIE